MVMAWTLQYDDGNCVATMNGLIASQPRENALEFENESDALRFKAEQGLKDVEPIWDELRSVASTVLPLDQRA
jgi:hypothetical protein